MAIRCAYLPGCAAQRSTGHDQGLPHSGAGARVAHGFLLVAVSFEAEPLGDGAKTVPGNWAAAAVGAPAGVAAALWAAGSAMLRTEAIRLAQRQERHHERLGSYRRASWLHSPQTKQRAREGPLVLSGGEGNRTIGDTPRKHKGMAQLASFCSPVCSPVLVSLPPVLRSWKSRSHRRKSSTSLPRARECACAYCPDWSAPASI